MRGLRLFVGACLAAAVAPSFRRAPPLEPPAIELASWPDEYAQWTPDPLDPRGERFARGFPGQISVRRNGERVAVLRSVIGATRQLHPASDCFRGAGYAVTPKPQRLESGRLWGCFRAERGGERLDVCEHVEGAGGASWPDVSAWYWPALLGRAAGPFRAITRVAPATD